MAIRKILRDHDPFLRKPSRTVERFDDRLHHLLDDMKETMEEAGGVGLAAVQVGVLRRAVTIDAGEGLIELVNPEIVAVSGEQDGPEGCLSSPGEYGMVLRPMKVRVRAQDRNGKPFEMEGKELLARAFCHEIDHLNGRLFKDLVSRMLSPEELKG
jgi:peptide deformylase